MQQSDTSKNPTQIHSQIAIEPIGAEAQNHNPIKPGFIDVPVQPPHNFFRSVIRGTQCRCCSMALWWNEIVDPMLKEER
jgi:hypothetical protein